MPDDDQPGDTNQRRAAVLRIIEPPAESPERATGQQITNLTRKRPPQLVTEQRLHCLDETLAGLEHHVAGEPVTHHHVRHAAIDLSSFDVAYEIDRCSLQELMRLARQLI